MPFMEDLCPLHIEIVFPIFRSTDYQGGVSNWIIEAISKDLKKNLMTDTKNFIKLESIISKSWDLV